ncbi:MAG: hypothetical protein WC325_10765 [Candidatus Bathyarchaeia archaeon]
MIERFKKLQVKAQLALLSFTGDTKARFTFNWKGFVILAGLVYGGFIVGDWFTGIIGVSDWGMVGTLLALLIPTVIIYVVWRNTSFFKKNIQ